MAILGAIAGGLATGVGGSLLNRFLGHGGGGSSQGSTQPWYVPTGLSAADQQWQRLYGGMGGYAQGQAGLVQPNLAAAYAQMQGIDPTGYLSAANYAGNQYAGLAGQANQFGDVANYWGNQANQNMQGLYGAGQTMGGYAPGAIGMGQSAANLAPGALQYGAQAAGLAGGAAGLGNRLAGYGDTVMNAAMDPQSALYNKYLQQTVDTSRAGTSARGIGMSGEAAGLENEAVNNFNQQWQNQQLGRMTSALGATTGAYGTGLSGYGTAGGLLGTGLQGYGTAGGLIGTGLGGYGAAAGLGGAQAALSNAGRGYGQLGGADQSAAMGYYGMSPQYAMAMGQVPYEAQINAAGLPFQAAQMYGQGMQSNVYGPYGQTMGQAIPYMNYGQGAQQGAYNQFMGNMGMLGSGLSGLAQYGPQAWNAVSNWFGNQGQPTYDPNSGNYGGGYVDPGAGGGLAYP